MRKEKSSAASLMLALLLGSAGLLIPRVTLAAAVTKAVQSERAAVAASLPPAEKHAPVQFTAVQVIDGVPAPAWIVVR